MPFNMRDGNKLVSSEGSTVTRAESLLALLSLGVRHNLSGEALRDVVELINLHCPGTLPSSKYLFNNSSSDYLGVCDFHFYCSLCKGYIECLEETPNECINCNTIFNKEESLKEGQFFIVMPLENQLRSLLETKKGIADLLLNREMNSNDNDISGIVDGLLYKQMFLNGPLSDKNNFSLIFNTDGVPIFKSSNFSIWPLLCGLNELPIKERKENILLSALWFGNDRPNMDTFFKPFVDECNKLNQTGFLWTVDSNSKNVVRSKVYPIICCADAQARCMLQNMVQFNGYFGCGFCKHKGEYDHDSNSMKYPFCDPKPPLRSEQGTKADSILAAETGNKVNGVKGVSILSFLLYFNIISGFIPDYMHAVCLGTVRRFFFMWTDSSNADQPYYLGRKIKILSNRIAKLKPPKEIQRIPRTVDMVKYWKASEWRSFLFYSLPILSGILPSKYLAHWALFVQSMFYLCSDTISQESLHLSEFLLCKFIIFMEPLYGRKEMTYNAHLLSHMHKSVNDWGPLWGTSAFMFESFNGKLKKLFNGTRCVPGQTFKKMCILQDIHRHYSKVVSPVIEGYIQRVLFQISVTKNATFFQIQSARITTFGSSISLELSPVFRIALYNYLGERIIARRATSYNRFTINNVLLSTSQYSKKFKRTDCVIELEDGSMAEIIHFVTFKNHDCIDACACEKHVFLLLRKLQTIQKLKFIYGGLREIGCTTSFIREVKSGRTFAVNPNVNFKKAMEIQFQGKRYTITLPNRLEE